MRRDTRISEVLLIVIVWAGFLLRAWGIFSGLPYLFNVDEPIFVNPAIAMVANGDLNPHYFGHPASTTIYLLAALYAGWYLIGLASGAFSSAKDLLALVHNNPTGFYLIGRMMIVLFGTASIVLVYSISRRVSTSRGALAATLFFAVSPLHVAFSSLIRADIIMTFFALSALVFSFLIYEKKTTFRVVCAGVCAGCAIASKFTGVITAVPVLLSCLLAARDDEQGGSFGRDALIVVIAAAVTFAAWSPYFFIDCAKAMADIMIEARPYHLGHNRLPGVRNYLWYITGPLTTGMGTGIEVLAGLGLIYFSWKRRGEWLILASFTVCFIVFIGSLRLRWDRWVIPVLPCGAIFAGAFLDEIVGRCMRGRVANLSAAALGIGSALLAAGPLRDTLEHCRRAHQKDVRILAVEWIERNVSPGARIMVEQYGPPISRENYQVFVCAGGRPSRDTSSLGWKNNLACCGSMAFLRDAGIEYVILTVWHDRFLEERERSAGALRMYETFFREAELVKEFRSRDNPVRIYRLKPGAK